MPSCENFGYMFLNLVGEMGEFASKVAKAIRKDQLAIGWSESCEEANESNLVPTASYFCWEELNEALRAEGGDILWQLMGLYTIMGWNAEEIAQENLAKLAARKAAGTIDGNGDGIYDR